MVVHYPAHAGGVQHASPADGVPVKSFFKSVYGCPLAKSGDGSSDCPYPSLPGGLDWSNRGRCYAALDDHMVGSSSLLFPMPTYFLRHHCFTFTWWMFALRIHYYALLFRVCDPALPPLHFYSLSEYRDSNGLLFATLMRRTHWYEHPIPVSTANFGLYTSAAYLFLLVVVCTFSFHAMLHLFFP